MPPIFVHKYFALMWNQSVLNCTWVCQLHLNPVAQKNDNPKNDRYKFIEYPPISMDFT